MRGEGLTGGSPGRERTRVLVVEDDADLAELLADVLLEEGYAVDRAENGAVALERMRQQPPALVLLDLLMPVMDGWTFLDECRQDARWSDVSIVLLSAAWDILNSRIGSEEHGWTILHPPTLDPNTRPFPGIVSSANIQSVPEHQEPLSRRICALPKPFDLDALLETVGAMLPQQVEHRPGQASPDKL